METKKRISLPRFAFIKSQLRSCHELWAATETGVHSIERTSIDDKYMYVPESTVMILCCHLGPTGKIVYVYRAKQNMRRAMKFFADHHTPDDVEKKKQIPRTARGKICEFLWGN